MVGGAIDGLFPDFPSDFRGERLAAGDAGFDKSRKIFNMRTAGQDPALIVRPADAADVACVMRYASAKGIPVGIRSGGHGVDGSAMPAGQLVIDLSGFREMSVDPQTGIARAGSGILLGDIDKACQEHGLVVPAGTVSTTGVAGLTLGGGVGYNMRRYGATVDNLLSCDVVTADGRIVKASETENPDLFWALRGGGGNFGVVTAFEFQARPVGPIVGGGVVLYKLDDAAGVMRKLAQYMKTAARELQVIGALVPTPDIPGMPEDYVGVYALALLTVYTGDLANLDSIVADLSAFTTPVAVAVQPLPWVVVNSILDMAAPYGRSVHSRGGYLASLTDEVIDAVIGSARAAPPPEVPGPSTVQNVWFMGGAISEDFDEDYVAFSREGAEIFWEAVSQWDSPAAAQAFVDWTNAAAAALDPYMLGNGYVNLTTDCGPEWLSRLYGKPEKFERLLTAKKKWDPQNLFRFNKNFKVQAS